MLKKISVIMLIFIIVLQINIYAAEYKSDRRLLTLTHSGEHNYFETYAEPGQIVELEYCLANRSLTMVTNQILIYDSLTAVNGGNVIMSPDNLVADETASWFSENQSNATLAPGEEVEKRMILMVPKNCNPGKYTAIIGLYADEQNSKSVNEEDIVLKINQSFTSTLAIVINVGMNPKRSMQFGENARVEINSQTGVKYLFIPVENIGNAYEFPIISIVAKNNNNEIIIEDQIEMDIVYCKTNTYACFEVEEIFSNMEEYSIYAKLYSKNSETFNETKKVFSISIDEFQKDIIEKAHIRESIIDIGDTNGEDFYILDKRDIVWIIIFGLLFVICLGVIIVILTKKTQRKLKVVKVEQ